MFRAENDQQHAPPEAVSGQDAPPLRLRVVMLPIAVFTVTAAVLVGILGCA
ncbi:hypothetical protein ACWC24_40295 [Streptomyces sp. NPDC001443]